MFNMVFDLYNALMANKDALIMGALAVVPVASIIVKFTPNEVDNKVLDKVLDILNFLALNNNNRK